MAEDRVISLSEAAQVVKAAAKQARAIVSLDEAASAILAQASHLDQLARDRQALEATVASLRETVTKHQQLGATIVERETARAREIVNEAREQANAILAKAKADVDGNSTRSREALAAERLALDLAQRRAADLAARHQALEAQHADLETKVAHLRELAQRIVA